MSDREKAIFLNGWAAGVEAASEGDGTAIAFALMEVWNLSPEYMNRVKGELSRDLGHE